MKKYLLLTLLLIIILPTASLNAAAICYDPLCTTNLISNATGMSSVDPIVIASRLINTALGILGILSLVLIIYAGFIWMLARGNEEEVTKAREILKGAAMGLVIILGSYSIGYFVFFNLVQITNAYGGAY